MNGYLTANPKPFYATRNAGLVGGLLNHEIQSFKEIVSKRKPLKAFCQCRCSQKPRTVYKVIGLTGLANFVENVTRDDVGCPNCEGALFWSRNYELADSKNIKLQDHARKQADEFEKGWISVKHSKF